MRLKSMLPTAGILACVVSTQAFAAPMIVTCGPGQRAIVSDAFVRGEAVTRVECVWTRAHRYATYRTRHRGWHRHRSWGKTALIISGSAATGAGIGGIIHGKTGALIGAAVGGGAASLYEGAHRR